jgi:hypothetical protein
MSYCSYAGISPRVVKNFRIGQTIHGTRNFACTDPISSWNFWRALRKMWSCDTQRLKLQVNYASELSETTFHIIKGNKFLNFSENECIFVNICPNCSSTTNSCPNLRYRNYNIAFHQLPCPSYHPPKRKSKSNFRWLQIPLRGWWRYVNLERS